MAGLLSIATDHSVRLLYKSSPVRDCWLTPPKRQREMSFVKYYLCNKYRPLSQLLDLHDLDLGLGHMAYHRVSLIH